MGPLGLLLMAEITNRIDPGRVEGALAGFTKNPTSEGILVRAYLIRGRGINTEGAPLLFGPETKI